MCCALGSKSMFEVCDRVSLHLWIAHNIGKGSPR